MKTLPDIWCFSLPTYPIFWVYQHRPQTTRGKRRWRHLLRKAKRFHRFMTSDWTVNVSFSSPHVNAKYTNIG